MNLFLWRAGSHQYLKVRFVQAHQTNSQSCIDPESYSHQVTAAAGTVGTGGGKEAGTTGEDAVGKEAINANRNAARGFSIGERKKKKGNHTRTKRWERTNKKRGRDSN